MNNERNTSQTLAVFDFDDTLIKGDSMWMFFWCAAGAPLFILAFVRTVAQLIMLRIQKPNDALSKDIRDFIKARMMKYILSGKSLSEIQPAVVRLAQWKQWNRSMRQALLDHAASGHHVVIASGSLDIYLPDLVWDIPHDAIICTKVGIQNGILDGAMANGNCVRQRKAELVAEYMAVHGPFADSWGYGNYPHDVPMLALMKRQILV